MLGGSYSNVPPMMLSDRLPYETAANGRRYVHQHQLEMIASARQARPTEDAEPHMRTAHAVGRGLRIGAAPPVGAGRGGPAHTRRTGRWPRAGRMQVDPLLACRPDPGGSTRTIASKVLCSRYISPSVGNPLTGSLLASATYSIHLAKNAESDIASSSQRGTPRRQALSLTAERRSANPYARLFRISPS